MDKRYIHKFIWDSSKHNKEFYAKIEDKMSYLLNPKSLDNIELIIAEIKKLGLPTKSSKQPFLQNVLVGYANNNIQVFSMNSSSLTLNPDILREKPQYKKITYLNDMIAQLGERTGINFSYTSILPDYDQQYPFDTYEKAWENNKHQIESVSGIKTERLSQMAPGRFEEISANLGSYMDTQLLDNEIRQHAESYSDLITFSAPKDFSKKQIITYSVTGIILEELIPSGILLDVQKRCYPFEQPFYNFARKEKLPIILCGQEITDGKEKQKFSVFQTIRDL